MNSEAKNLEAITAAIKGHKSYCDGDILEIVMNPFEVDRLDWDNIMGIPIVGDSKLGTGAFKLVCSNDSTDNIEEVETVEAVSKDKELTTV
jgi:hypothetical protein